MYRASIVLLCGLIVNACDGPTLRKKVLIIGIDGVRSDILARASTPNIDRLAAAGLYSGNAQTRMPTVSGPGWSSMLIGVWSDKHGVLGNDFSDNRYGEYPDVLSRLEMVAPSTNTLAVVDWPPLGDTVSGGPLIGASVDEVVRFDG